MCPDGHNCVVEIGVIPHVMNPAHQSGVTVAQSSASSETFLDNHHLQSIAKLRTSKIGAQLAVGNENSQLMHSYDDKSVCEKGGGGQVDELVEYRLMMRIWWK